MEFCKKQSLEDYEKDSKKFTKEAVKNLNLYIKNNPESLMHADNTDSYSSSASSASDSSSASDRPSKQSKSNKQSKSIRANKHLKSNNFNDTNKSLENTIYLQRLEINNLMIKVEELESDNENLKYYQNVVQNIIKYMKLLESRPKIFFFSKETMDSYINKCDEIKDSFNTDDTKESTNSIIINEYISRLESLKTSVKADFKFQSNCVFRISVFICLLGIYIYILCVQ